MSKNEQTEKKPFDFEAFREETMARLKAGGRVGGPDGIESNPYSATVELKNINRRKALKKSSRNSHKRP